MDAKDLEELKNQVAVLHFAVTQLYVVECQRQSDPVVAANALLKQVEDAIRAQPGEEARNQSAERLGHLQNSVRDFFAQVVSDVQLQETGRADA